MTLNCTNQTNKTINAIGNNFSSCINHGLKWIHNIHHGMDLGGGITLLLILYSTTCHMALILNCHFFKSLEVVSKN